MTGMWRQGLWLLALGVVAAPTVRGDAIAWRTDPDVAFAEARKTGKSVLANIHTSWCGPCRRLQATTLQDPSLARLINERCIPLSLDGDERADLVERWGVEGFPTQLVISPTGRVLERISGYVSVADYASALRSSAPAPRAFVSGGQRAAPPNPPRRDLASRPIQSDETERATPNRAATRPESPARFTPPPPAAFVNVPPLPKTPAPSPSRRDDDQAQPCDAGLPLALDGFCPVSMIVKAELIPGADVECVVYRGLRYHFASERERRMFLDAPNRFLPAEEGRCVVTFVEEGRWITGDVAYPAIFGEHVFFFPSDSQRQKFLHDPERYVDAGGHARSLAVMPDRGSELR